MNIKLSEIPTKSGIYKFTNTVNKKLYIGSAKNKKIIKHHYIFDLSFDYNSIITDVRKLYEFIWNYELTDNYIMMYDVFGNLITGFGSLDECSEVTSINKCTIRDSLTGRSKQAKGFIFRYNDDIV